jgi:hypothetical protein
VFAISTLAYLPLLLVGRKSSPTHEGAIGEKEQQRGREGNRNEGNRSGGTENRKGRN